LTDGVFGGLAQLRETVEESRFELAIETEHVREDEDLAVAIGTRSDPDGRDLHRRSDGGGDLTRNQLEDQRERARVLESLRLGHETLARIRRSPLHAAPAEPVHRLRGEAEVTHHRDARLDDAFDGRG